MLWHIATNELLKAPQRVLLIDFGRHLKASGGLCQRDLKCFNPRPKNGARTLGLVKNLIPTTT